MNTDRQVHCMKCCLICKYGDIDTVNTSIWIECNNPANERGYNPMDTVIDNVCDFFELRDILRTD